MIIVTRHSEVSGRGFEESWTVLRDRAFPFNNADRW